MIVNKNNWEDYKGWSEFELENVLSYYMHEIISEGITGKRIVSVGIGQGFPEVMLKQKGARVLGIDANKELLDISESLGLETRLLDAYKIKDEVQANSADQVIATFFVHNTPNERMFDLYSNFFHMLKEGGKLVVLDPNASYEHITSTDEKTFRRPMDLGGRYLDSAKLDPATDKYMIEINLNKGLPNETTIVHQHKSDSEYRDALVKNGFRDLKKLDVGYQIREDGKRFPAYQIWTARR